jgi:hypothetical protein
VSNDFQDMTLGELAHLLAEDEGVFRAAIVWVSRNADVLRSGLDWLEGSFGGLS